MKALTFITFTVLTVVTCAPACLADTASSRFTAVYNQYESATEKDKGGAMLPLRNPFIPQIPISIPETPKPEPPVAPRPEMPRLPTVPQPPMITPTPVQRVEKPKIPQMKISGLVWNSKRPQAIINDQVFNIGDKIENFTLEKINKDGIVLTNGDDKFTVPY